MRNGGKMSRSTGKTILNLRNISKSYQNGKNELLVLDELSLDIDESDFVSIMGKSGSGKTTLLNIIALLDREYSGEVIYNNRSIRDLNRKQLFQLRSSSIGYVFQNHNLIHELNVLQNVEMPLGYLGCPKDKRRMRALELLKEVGLEGREKAKVHELSGGQQQRVAIARALSISPKVLIADEPTGNLDESTSDSIMDLLKSLNHKLKTTIILVTHDEDISQKCSRRMNLRRGKLYEE